MSYTVTLKSVKHSKTLHNLSISEVMEIEEKAKKKGITVIVHETTKEFTCDCRYHLGCLSPELCQKEK